MKRSIQWKRPLGMLLAAALFTTQSGIPIAVSFAIDEVGQQLSAESPPTPTPIVEATETTPPTPTPAVESGSPGGELGVEVVDRPTPTPSPSTEEDLPPAETGTPQPEETDKPLETPAATETPAVTEVPEVTATPKPEETAEPGASSAPEETEGPQESKAPEETKGPEESQTPEASQAPEQPPNGDGWDQGYLPEIVENPLKASLMPLSDPILEMHAYRLGYGVDLKDSDNVTLGGAYFKENEFAFAVETTEADLPASYGHRDHTDSKLIPIVEDGPNAYTFCIFPSEAQLGRVPDQEFEGWYLYPSGVKTGSSQNSRTWCYGDIKEFNPAASLDRMRKEEDLIPYTAEDPLFGTTTRLSLGNYSKYGEWGDKWDGQKYYNDAEKLLDSGGEYHYDYSTSTGKMDMNNPVSFVGRWVASSESRAAVMEDAAGLFTNVDNETTNVVMYSESIAGKAIDPSKQVKFDRNRTEYWLRVSADVKSLDLLLNTYEIFLNYHDGRAECPVTVTNTFNGQTTDCVVIEDVSGESNLSSEMLPKAENNSYGSWLPTNSIDDPAHARWTLKNIQLHPAQNGDTAAYNDIKVTITAPNGVGKTTYTFHVQRLQEPLLTQAYGNTPAGMILRDPDTFWGGDPAANKQAALDYFKANHHFQYSAGEGETAYYPKGDMNAGGTIYHGVYSPNAWTGENTDLDPTAIVVYQNSAFLDPGISIVDGEGKPVQIGSGSVTRTLRLRQADTLSSKGVGADVGTECWYVGGENKLQTTAGSETLREDDGSDQIDLRGLNVLPGVYTMEYAYTDPVSGKVYDSTGAAFTTDEGRATKGNFTRTVVVLPTPGDVDMDGAVTSADAVFLKRELTNDSSSHLTYNGKRVDTDSAAALFVYRVCDVDQDGAVAAGGADQTALEALPDPQLRRVLDNGAEVRSDYFYLPLPTGEEDSDTRTALAEEGEGASGAKLSLVYLGKEGGQRQEGGHTVNPTGPWGSNDTAGGVTLKDTFWLGVRLTDGQKSELLEESVTTFTFSLVYDSDYLEPAVVLNKSNWEGAASEEARWRNMMRLYNLAGDQTVWSASSYNFTGAAGYGRDYVTDASAAILPLEAKTSGSQAGRESSLKKLVFSVSYNSNSGAYAYLNQEEAWLFAAPFTLIKHPYGQKTFQMVELGASMEDFTLIGQLDAGGSVKAYSIQSEITGGSTQNLRRDLHYTAAGVSVPLGVDKTEVYDIYNAAVGGSGSTQRAVYSTAFEATHGRMVDPETGKVEYAALGYGDLVGELPPGITRSSQGLSGIPEQAGTYEFRIGGNPFRMVVEKAPLQFWADDKSSYYGQPEFRGTASGDFTFSYNSDNILSLDKARAQESGGEIFLDGLGVHLAALIGEERVEPTFTARAGTLAVADTTNRGTYPIRCQSMPLDLKNYSLEYVERGTLSILPRPFRVTRIGNGTDVTNVSELTRANGEQVGVLFNDGGITKGNVPASLGRGVRGANSFLAELPGDGTYLNRPLTAQDDYLDGVLLSGDSLDVTYVAGFVQNARDLEGVAANAGAYTLEEGNLTELRNVRVSDLQVVGGVNSGNYNLVDDDPIYDVVEGQVVGTIRRRRIIALAIDQLPPMTYRYGEQLTRSNELHFYIKKEIDQQEGIYDYSEQGVAQLGVHVCWATPEEVENNAIGSLPYRTGQTFTMEYNGAKLCLWVDSVGSDGNPTKIIRYSDVALQVSSRTLTLTAKPTQRFYGEENGTLSFTYDPLQLASIDRQGKNLTGEGSELEEVLKDLGYTPPTVRAIDARDMEAASPREVTALSLCSGSYAVQIKGAKCAGDNYVFQYVYTAPSGQTEIRADYGASAFQILPRLIVVDQVIKTGDLAFAYADTHRVDTEITGANGRTAPLQLSDVVLGLPEHSETVTRYYPRGGRNDDKPLEMQASYAENTRPVLAEDEGKLYFTYTATLVSTDGPDYVNHVDFSKGYFNMEGQDEKGEKRYPVQVSNLQLRGEAAANYNLVFRGNSAALQALPQQTILVQGIDPEKVSDRNYYVPSIGGGKRGEGTVALRPIESIRILSTGKLNYTYGEVYSPNLVGADNRSMRIAIQYSTVDDNYAGNPYIGEVGLRISGHDEDGNAITSFDDRSLVIYWLGSGDTADQAVAAGQVLEFYGPLSVSPHNGARLMVAGKRGGQTELIKSEPTGADRTLRVAPRTLTLTAAEVKRCYGESNPDEYDFTFQDSQLAQWDRAALTALGLSAPYGNDALTALAASRGLDYTRPTGSTTAGPGSPVLNDGRGSYPITLSGGSLTNYTLNYVQGGLRVYPRPVRIDHFESDYEHKPIYTIFASTQNKVFNTNVTTQSSVDQPSAVMARPQGDWYLFSDGTSLSVSGQPVYDKDVLTLRIEVNFFEMSSLDGASGQPHNVRVDDAELVAGTTGANNYVLVRSGDSAAIANRLTVGAVKLRSINTIELDGIPRKLTYTYGESLDLSGLRVILRYDVIEGETRPDPIVVPYQGPDQFAQYGLYVNYYDSNKVPAQGSWASIMTDYPKAVSGDHLTIAPTHDSVEKGQSFSANGKYLIVSAQRHQDQEPSEPKIVADPIVVNPRQLTFTLDAEDKTYDGSTQAAGTLTFTNAYNQAGITDMVYPVTGAAREANWSSLAAGAESFNAYVTEKGYVFSTGTYVPAEEEPWGANRPLNWAEGYTYGGSNKLTFSFLDPNVAYQEEPTHDNYGALSTVPVQVTGIVLGGPDARNYSIASDAVTQSNVADLQSQGYQGSDLPQATIHKANRARLSTDVLPRAELDPNTNVVRVVYDRALSDVEQESPTYQQETHYEYALQYDTPDGDGAVLRQWAGADGESFWDDGRYFGGEAVTVTAPEGYIPREEDLPKEDSSSTSESRKGQVYAWSGEDTGFTPDLSAYPGSPEEPWPGYDLYRTDRTALPRDAVFWPLVRAAETHNYKASPILTSHREYTPELLQAVTGAWEDMLHAPTEGEQAEARARMGRAAEAAKPFVDEMTGTAKDAAEAEKALLAGIGESGTWPDQWPETGALSAVKTYLQRLAVISVEEKQGAGETGSEERYQVPTLEAVWFTDLLEYPKKEYMDAVLRNHEPVRYQGYAWDEDRSAELKFDDSPISLAGAFEVEITRKEDGEEIKETVRLNEDHTVQLYAALPSHSGGGLPLVPAEAVEIDGGDIQVAMGADPVTLTVTYTPANVTNRVIRWSSSDESVVTVDRNGKLTFVGIGVAVITATTVEGVSDSITVTVTGDDWKKLYPNSIFDFGKLDAYFDLGKSMMFYPERRLTRGETARLLVRFYVPNENWTRTGPKDFPDLTGEEEYAQAARLLGSLGVFLGLEDGRFGGEEFISRAEFITLLVRMTGLEVRNTAGMAHAFLDTGEEDTWAYSEIDAMSRQTQVLKGVGEGYFAPARKITRAETAAFLSRLLSNPTYKDPEKLKIPLDVGKEHWARDAIIRAVNDTIPKR